MKPKFISKKSTNTSFEVFIETISDKVGTFHWIYYYLQNNDEKDVNFTW